MIPLPVKGQKINAWARELTEEVNRLAPMGGSGLLVRGGHGAFGFEPLPGNPKAAPLQPKKVDLGLFVPDYDDDTRLMCSIGAGYLQTSAGTIAVAGADFPLEGLVATTPQGSENDVYSGIVAINITRSDDELTAELAGYANLSAMIEAQSPEQSVIPVYELSASKITRDFRALATLPDGGAGVRTVNELAGNLVLLGGPKIRISKDEESGEITIAFDETKDETDDPSAAPEDPCAHPGNPGNRNHGGVAVEWSSPVAGGAAVDASAGNGGVAAGGDSHTGDNNCNC